jgi:predicted house-cleaning noncanonical NTP pyrophosphatase (MazG superfamily)
VGKLVRDKIPDLIIAAGQQPRARVLDDDSYAAALFDKLVEEAQELRAADPRERLEEAADVYEVLLAVAALLGVTLADGATKAATKAATKRAERCAFTERIWLDGLEP